VTAVVVVAAAKAAKGTITIIEAIVVIATAAVFT
jgi:hypothetical protein